MTTMFDAIDAYCRRSGPACGTQPVNAATNLAFHIPNAAMLAG